MRCQSCSRRLLGGHPCQQTNVCMCEKEKLWIDAACARTIFQGLCERRPSQTSCRRASNAWVKPVPAIVSVLSHGPGPAPRPQQLRGPDNGTSKAWSNVAPASLALLCRFTGQDLAPPQCLKLLWGLAV